MTAVENGMSLRRAAEMFGVPKSSLHDRTSGKIQHGARPGPPSYLTLEQEGELVNFLIRCADIGYPHTVAQVIALVQLIVDQKGIKRSVTHGWWQRFCERHKEISLCTAVPLAIARAKATNHETIGRYFDMLEDTLKENGIFNNPMRIYNCDETGMPLNPKGVKVVAKTGCKNVSSISGDTKTQITVLACTCATGIALPPLVIFDRKTLNPEMTVGEIPGTLYGLSKTGWINRELFFQWFYRHFLVYCPPIRPLLLLMDGHSSHYCPDVITAAAQEKVILFTLPPHTTHLAQPLDVGCFSPLKSCWKQVCHNFYKRNPGRVVSRYDFSHLFSEAWMLAMSQKNIRAGFSATGVYPFNPRKVQDQICKENPSAFHPESLPHRTGLAYIPLYSPVCDKRSKYSPYYEQSTTTLSDVNASFKSFYDYNNELEPSTAISPSNRSLSLGDINHFNEVSLTIMPLRKASSISQFLSTPKPLPMKCQKTAGKVLTSIENIEAIKEKERIKQEKIDEKEKRKVARAKAKEAKASAKQQRTCRGVSVCGPETSDSGLENEDNEVKNKTGSKLFCYFWIYMYMNVWHTIGKKQVTRKTRGVCDEDSLVETKTGSKLFCYFWI